MGVTRIRVDIGDLHLGRALDTLDTRGDTRGVVGVSKHLCGAATDLTLRCLAGTLPESNFRGLMIALCCHHRCDWNSYVGKQFLIDQGFSRSSFHLLVSMSSWATCGFGRVKKTEASANQKPVSVSANQRTEPGEEAEHESDHGQEFHPNDRYSRMGLSETNREAVGRLCKRVLDYGRVTYLKSFFPTLSVELKHYVSSEVSLENALLLCTFANS